MTDVRTPAAAAAALEELLGELPATVTNLPLGALEDLAAQINLAIERETAEIRSALQAALQKLPAIIRVSVERLIE
ncbi:hypothetical protein ACIRRA_35780 [Nocardia sp. NPDC101769]|uniref:hypothetical protein n=1 Tax=Nocardia sp. NPDC101769 TaxID=3364333 RepID=UPI0038217166